MRKFFERKFITALLTVCLIATGVFAMPVLSDSSYAGNEQDNWSSFRGENNGHTAGATPRAAVEASLKWQPKTFTSTAQWNSAGTPIIVGDYIYIAVGNKLYKINKSTSEMVSAKLGSAAEGAADAQIGYTSFIAYGDGKIYVPLSGGDVQAFDANTLKSVWYAKYKENTDYPKMLVQYWGVAGTVVMKEKDALALGDPKPRDNYKKGDLRSVTPLEYRAETPVLYDDVNKRIYTGVYNEWSNNKTYGTFFAIDAKDGTFVWEYEETSSDLRGFYWAGVCDAGDYVLVAGDAGRILALNKNDGGAANDSVDISAGNGSYARAGMTYISPDTSGGIGSVYVSTKAGKLWKASFNETSGKFTGAAISATLSGGPGASAPVIVGDKLYAFSGYINRSGKLDVFNKNDLKLKSTLDFGGYSQSFPLVTDYYASKSGNKTFLYVALNEVGNDAVIAIEDAPNFSKPKAHTLYKPGGSQSLNSIMADSAGTLYFIDGKGKLNALSSKKLDYDPTDVQGFKSGAGGKKYYVDGAAVKGWKTIGGKKYYFNANGIMQTGLKTIGKKKYYFGSNGAAVKGWKTVSKKKYYFGVNYIAKTGLTTIGKKKYYFGSNGAAIKGWKKVKGKKYYFGANYIAKTGKQNIGGKTYKFNSKGILVK
jgi:outer membrane protein assembly factor BamB